MSSYSQKYTEKEFVGRGQFGTWLLTLRQSLPGRLTVSRTKRGQKNRAVRHVPIGNLNYDERSPNPSRIAPPQHHLIQVMLFRRKHFDRRYGVLLM